MKKFMFYVAFVASLGGLLFGFDTAVISGAEKDIQDVYGLSDFLHGFTMSSALIGTIIGALFSTSPVEKYGRQKSLIVIALMYLLSAIGSALAPDNAWWLFIFSRFLGGLAVGASSVAGPLYIAEVSPSHWRGRFVAFFQFNIVLGIVLAYFSNYLIDGFDNDWRWMLGVESIPALLFAILLFTIPESPRWLMGQGKEQEARRVLALVDDTNLEQQVAEIRASLAEDCKEGEPLFQRKYWKPILIAFLIATFNQLAGINAILYYAPRIFEMSGVAREGSLLQSIIIGLTNLTFTMIGMVLIDKVGRKKLLYIGSLGMTLALGTASYGFYNELTTGYLLLFCVMVFIAFFAVSLGACIWVVIAEVFPNSVRGKGQVLGSMTHWFWSALLTWTFPVFLGTGSSGGGLIFCIFAVMSALSIVFAWKLPETKNKSLEQIQNELVCE
ncbi:MAG: sugar porter family MFS transporter [Bacteroidaceae bacterium]|nr:sugar porter family MFS transporter [Bacteroidaceae bacterium]MBQ6225910.1 sugar porter family MFS transporter [Bacteroidaceae bacterium]